METIWIWTIYEESREPSHVRSPIERLDVTGFDVEARDGKIGKVDEATYEAGTSCLIVDTGFWIFGKRRMIPAGFVEQVDEKHGVVRVACTKQHIKEAPDFDEARRDDEDQRKEVTEHYDRLHTDATHGAASG